MMMERLLTSWKLHTDPDQILWLTFHRDDQPHNFIHSAALQELSLIVEELHQPSSPIRGVILNSDKKDFAYGADLNTIDAAESEVALGTFIREGQDVFYRLQQLRCPTVAVIRGWCLGGGLELALACDYRLALDEPHTQLGLPEIKLGIHPGWGGTVRLPALIGPIQAFEMMLTGVSKSAREAQHIGLVHEALPERHLNSAARAYVLNPPPRKKSIYLTCLNGMGWRPFFAFLFRQQLRRKKIKPEHYPAPFALIDQWAQSDSLTATPHNLQTEALSVMALAQTDTAKNLFRVFQLQNQLKQGTPVPSAHHTHIHVIGAGTMGADIAGWCALQGYRVTLEDKNPEAIALALKRLQPQWSARLNDPRRLRDTQDRLIPDFNQQGRSKADVIIEAIVENEAFKRNLFKELESQVRPDAWLLTNTSCIGLDKIAQALQQPERLFGLHFFNPVFKMPLVEVINNPLHHNETHLQALKSFTRSLGKLPLCVRSAPGFLVNRVLMPYLMEAFLLLEEGHSPTLIDQAAVTYGMPMGPIELCDTIGLDVCQSVMKHLLPDATLSQNFLNLIEQGALGKKTQRGFYTYRNKKAVRQSLKNIDPQIMTMIQQRLILRLHNEAAACWREGVVSSLDEVDAGIIFGTGYAPFREGPLHAALQQGVSEILSQLQHAQNTWGERFAPDPQWHTLHKNAVSQETP